MLWIKRNVFLVVFGVIALGLLGWSVMYLINKLGTNSKLEQDLQAAKTELEDLLKRKPFPSKTNIQVARDELVRVRTNVNTVKQYFTPVPFEKVADKDFTVVLQNTIFDLQKRAQQSGIGLPESDYAFSFKAQKNALTFAPGSFPTLPEQLAEIKAITEVVYDAKVNRIANIQRMRVTTDDPAGSTDYHGFATATNNITGTVSNPYEFTVYSFSAELGKLIEGLYKSKHGFILKSLEVELAPEAPAAAPGMAPRPFQPPPQPQAGQSQPPRPVVPPAGAAKPGAKAETFKTVLNEKLLRAKLMIEVIKPIK